MGQLCVKRHFLLYFTRCDFCKNNNWLLLLPPRRFDCSCCLQFREANSKGGVFVGFEKHIHLFIRLIRTSLREPLSLVLPCSIGGNTWESTNRVRQWLHLCMFFCCCMFPTLGCFVCVFLQPLQTIQTLFYQEIAYFYTFFYFFFRLKFSKTPFHVVLSKNKTNTKKKISFLIINFCFFPQFTVFNSVHKCEPFTPKTNGSRVCFCYFLRGFHFFHSFFLDFFLYFVTKIYFSALERARVYTTNSVLLHITFIPTVVSIVLLS